MVSSIIGRSESYVGRGKRVNEGTSPMPSAPDESVISVLTPNRWVVDRSLWLQYLPFRNTANGRAIKREEKSVSVSTEPAKKVQAEPRLVRALEQLSSLLVPGETIEAYAVQRRFFALLHRRELVAATSGRLIHMKRGLFGGFQPTSVRWQDLKEVRVKVGMLGANLTVYFFGSPDLAITGGEEGLTFPGLSKDQAEAVYRVCQAQDQAWREKRRVRELEEMRARSGGIQLGASGAGLGLAASPGADDTVARLEKAKAMLDKGLISDAEFEALKARIVNTL
jgi:Short C-terminal domain